MKHKILLFIGILISLIGYTKEIQIKTINIDSTPIKFVKVSSEGICLGFTDESGTLILDDSNIVGNKILLEKSIYHPKEIILKDEKDKLVFDLKILDNSTVPKYSTEGIYSMIDQVLNSSKEKSPNKQIEGFVSYSLKSSLNVKPVVKDDIPMQFLVKSSKIKMLGEIEESMEIWLKSILKEEPVRNRIYKSLYEKSGYTCSIESSYVNDVGNNIIVVDLVKDDKNKKSLYTQLVINNSNKMILEFHNSFKGKNENTMSEPDYHAIYSVKNDLVFTEYLSAIYIYQKNGETDSRNIQVLFK